MNHSGCFLAITGAVLQLPAPLSLLIGQLRFNGAFSAAKMNQMQEVSEVESALNEFTRLMASQIDLILWTIGVAILGLVAFSVAVTKYKYRGKWAYWFGCIYGCCFPLVFIWGTPLGLFLVIYSLRHRQEYGMPAR